MQGWGENTLSHPPYAEDKVIHCLRSKSPRITDLIPIYHVLNIDIINYRKSSNMRRAFAIFLAICFISFSLDGRFVFLRWLMFLSDEYVWH